MCQLWLVQKFGACATAPLFVIKCAYCEWRMRQFRRRLSLLFWCFGRWRKISKQNCQTSFNLNLLKWDISQYCNTFFILSFFSFQFLRLLTRHKVMIFESSSSIDMYMIKRSETFQMQICYRYRTFYNFCFDFECLINKTGVTGANTFWYRGTIIIVPK